MCTGASVHPRQGRRAPAVFVHLSHHPVHECSVSLFFSLSFFFFCRKKEKNRRSYLKLPIRNNAMRRCKRIPVGLHVSSSCIRLSAGSFHEASFTRSQPVSAAAHKGALELSDDVHMLCFLCSLLLNTPALTHDACAKYVHALILLINLGHEKCTPCACSPFHVWHVFTRRAREYTAWIRDHVAANLRR